MCTQILCCAHYTFVVRDEKIYRVEIWMKKISYNLQEGTLMKVIWVIAGKCVVIIETDWEKLLRSHIDLWLLGVETIGACFL